MAYSINQNGAIYNGDCIEVLKKFPDDSIDLVLTDPPYLVNYRDRTGRSIANDRDSAWVKPAFKEVARVLKPNRYCISFYGWNKIDVFLPIWRACGFTPVGHFVFSKKYASGGKFVRYCHESAYLLAKGSPAKPEELISDVQPWRYTGNKLHPTQKPLESLTPLIRAYSRPGQVVLDPFMGSGSTAHAAAKLERRYVGIELDAGYFQKAKHRLMSGDQQTEGGL
ncbi:Methyltransferase [Sulfidibacter corallicola]|uniref:Methyltransferase n=1 Tax=Sulfidibacter corallicola TaxID=2818388 RepID=A0A8A4TW11_SULCO|nr:DNA methyltransferase [Sulfidibacter corallicola]QTD50715.1 DNA methylase [Sulfidibacter corallicola]